MTCPEGFVTLQTGYIGQQQNVYDLYVGVYDTSEGAYGMIGKQDVHHLLLKDSITLQKGYMGQQKGVYALYVGVYATSKGIYETIKGCLWRTWRGYDTPEGVCGAIGGCL